MTPTTGSNFERDIATLRGLVTTGVWTLGGQGLVKNLTTNQIVALFEKSSEAEETVTVHNVLVGMLDEHVLDRSDLKRLDEKIAKAKGGLKS